MSEGLKHPDGVLRAFGVRSASPKWPALPAALFEMKMEKFSVALTLFPDWALIGIEKTTACVTAAGLLAGFAVRADAEEIQAVAGDGKAGFTHDLLGHVRQR